MKDEIGKSEVKGDANGGKQPKEVAPPPANASNGDEKAALSGRPAAGGGATRTTRHRTVRSGGAEDSSSDEETADERFYLPGAVHVQGPREGDDESIVAGDSEQVSHTTTPFEGEVVEDEREIESRVRARVERRMKDEIVDATGVEPVQKESVKNDSQGPSPSCVLILFVFGLIAVAAILASLLRSSSSKAGVVPADVTPAPTPVVDFRREYVVDLLVANEVTDLDLLSDEESPQHLALEWLVEDSLASKWLEMEEENNNDSDGDNDKFLIERYAAAVFYFSTNGANSSLPELGFLGNESICEWNTPATGIHCDNATGLVETMVFHVMGLNGTLPTEISAFRSIKELSGRRAAIYGTIPTEIGLLSRMETFKFPDNLLTGTIPTEIELLTNLRIIYLWVNHLSGTVPSGLFQITTLRGLDLAENWDLTGTIPEFGNLEELHDLILDINQFTGTIPQTFYTNLPNIEYVRLDRNKLSGTISTEIGTLSDLEEFHCPNNQISGPIPTEIGLLQNLEYLLLDYNHFSQSIPSEIGLIGRAQEIDLANNDLTGSIPSEIENLSRLRILRLSSNGIEGVIPAGFAQLPVLGTFDLHNTSMEYDGFEAFCNQTSSTSITGDCLGDDPEVLCPCCSSCSNDITGEAVLNLPRVCDIKAMNYEAIDHNDEVRASTCSCPLEGMGHNLSCTETCETCSKDGAVCFTNTGYSMDIDDGGILTRTHSQFVFTKGRLSETVVVDFWDHKEGGNINVPTCSVFLNGEECSSCAYFKCSNGFSAWVVDCSNFDDIGGYYTPCELPPDNYDDYGAVAVFAMQDEFLRSGCRPWLLDIGDTYFSWAF